MSALAFVERFARTLTPEPFRQLARQARWLKRQGKIDAFEFFTALAFGQLSAGRLTLAAQAQGLAEAVTRQAVDQRFTPAAVVYFQGAFAHLLAQTLAATSAQPQAAWLRAHFQAVYLLDSSSFDGPAALQKLFPACGGDGSAANVKVLLRYECLTGQLEPLAVLAGKRSDQSQALPTARRLAAGQLELTDKGFYDFKAWLAAEQNGAFLLMPLAAKLPTAMLSYVYRLRWQVELIFRQLKTVLRLDQTESQNPCRVQCEIWARLSAAVLLFAWHAHASAECDRLYQCAASFEKVIRLFQQWGLTLGRARWAQPAALQEVLRQVWRQILRHGRKGRQKSRPTTWENIASHWPATPSMTA